LKKLYAVEVYNLWMCMKEENPGLKISSGIIICVGHGYPQ